MRQWNSKADNLKWTIVRKKHYVDLRHKWFDSLIFDSHALLPICAL